VLFLGIIVITFSTIEPIYINEAFEINDQNMGKTTAFLYLVDYCIRFIFALIYGPLIDAKGREIVFRIAIVLVSLGYFLVPILNQNLFPGYFLAKSLYSSGIIGLQMLPLAADYVDNSTKGIMAAMNFGIAFLGGGVGALLLKVLSFVGAGFKGTYWTLSIILLVLGLIIRTGIKKGNTYYKNGMISSQGEIEEIKDKWNQVKKAFKEVPWVSISVIFGILGNSDFYILTTGLVIWMKSLIPADEDPITISANYQVIFALMSFILTAWVGFKIDKVPHMKLILPILTIATLGFILVPFVNSAYSPLLYIFFAIEGASLPGVLVYSAYLSYRYYPPEIRGTLSGIANAICFFGAIIILSLGGVLHDSWRKDASFLLYAVLMLISLLLVIIIHKKMKIYQNRLSEIAMTKIKGFRASTGQRILVEDNE